MPELDNISRYPESPHFLLWKAERKREISKYTVAKGSFVTGSNIDQSCPWHIHSFLCLNNAGSNWEHGIYSLKNHLDLVQSLYLPFPSCYVLFTVINWLCNVAYQIRIGIIEDHSRTAGSYAVSKQEQEQELFCCNTTSKNPNGFNFLGLPDVSWTWLMCREKSTQHQTYKEVSKMCPNNFGNLFLVNGDNTIIQ